jgi:P-type Cu2+ transporter
MQATTPIFDLSSQPSPAVVSSARETNTAGDASHLNVLDEPQEWLMFSRSVDELPAYSGLWESQVVVSGMHCAGCSLKVEQALLASKGVVAARVSAASGRASVTWSAALTRPSKWMQTSNALGYRLQPASDAFSPDHSRQVTRLALWRWLVAGFCMMQIMMYATPTYFAAPGEITPDIVKLLRWASWVLSLPVILFSSRPFFEHAYRDLKQRSISMDLPVTLGIAITFMVSSAATFEPQGWWGQEVYFDSLTMFVFFLLTGRWLEQRLRDRTAGALGHLMQRIPDSVDRLLANGQFERVALRRLEVGDVVRVLPGEAFPADGSIVLGSTFADEALLTGESRPMPRALDSQVIAGSYNLSSAVQMRIEQVGKTTHYAQIVALMQQAAVDKPRLAVLADQIAKPFLMFVLLAAAGAAAFWWNTDPARALMAAVAVLVVTCPCALSLATPTAMLTSAGWLAKHGVLVRRLQAIESLVDIDTVVFDKTDTLTEAQMGLSAVHTRAGISELQALQLAFALAQHSLHPASRAVVVAYVAAHCGDSPIEVELTEVKEFAGQGLEGKFTEFYTPGCMSPLRLGSAKFCNVTASQSSGMQIVLADAAGYIARFDLDEVLRSDAQEAITALLAKGLDVQILSGDRALAVQRVASRLGICQVIADCTPQAKLAHLQALQQQGRKVMMVGDGLNDGPVLAAAHVSVALGNAVPLAQAQSDLVIPGAQLTVLPNMLLQATRTMGIVRQNLWWGAIYNALCVPLALAGWLPAWLAGLGMATSSLIVTANAARLAKASTLKKGI